MSRTMLALAFSCLVVSVAAAKTCIVIDNGQFLDSQFVLLKSSLGPGKVAPLQGYFAQFSSGQGTYVNFAPLSGQSVINSSGEGALGIVVHNVSVSAGGGGDGSTGNDAVQLICRPGPKGTLGVGDMCNGFYNTNVVSVHFITCGSPVAIP